MLFNLRYLRYNMFVNINDGIRQQRPAFSIFAAFSECWCSFFPSVLTQTFQLMKQI